MTSRKLGLPNAKEINQMSSDEIRESLKKLKTSLMTDYGRVKGKGQQLEQPQSIRETRRTIARMITILQKRGERAV